MVMSIARWVMFSLAWAIAVLSPFAHAGSDEAPSMEALWQQYLRPQAQWPALPEQAQPLAPLPDPHPLRAALDEPLVALGEKLFHDKRLSQTAEVSCASCHLASHAFADPRARSLGVRDQEGRRNAPALVNTHLWDHFFWDGRASSLETQAVMPVEDPLEMAHSPKAIVEWVRKAEDYRPLLQGLDTPLSDLDWSLLAKALAEFQRSLMDDPEEQVLDRFLLAVAAEDWSTARQSLSDEQLLGLHLFRTKAGCVKCHNGALLSDQRFHNMGLHYFGRKFEDLGRYEVTGVNEDMGAFRTPSLRHLVLTKPWMHNGLFTQLEGIVRMYEHGGARPRRPKDLPPEAYYPKTTELLVAFELSDPERQALLSFLKSL